MGPEWLIRPCNPLMFQIRNISFTGPLSRVWKTCPTAMCNDIIETSYVWVGCLWDRYLSLTSFIESA